MLTWSLKELGYPTHEQLAALGLTGPQFLDIVYWMIRGRKRFGDGWLRRVHFLSGFEVLDFLTSIER
jgi:hypothetical protein